MGVSSDGIVAFGFDLGEDLPDKIADRVGDGGDVDEFIAHLAGVQQWRDDMSDVESSAYWADKKKRLEEFPITIICYCSFDYPMYFLAINGTETRAWRGHVKTLDTAVQVDWAAKIKAFCEEWDIQYQEPQWSVFSMYG